MTSTTTQTKQLEYDDATEEIYDDDDQLYNLYAPPDRRIQTLQRLILADPSSLSEHIHKLIMMYNLSPIKKLKDFLSSLVTSIEWIDTAHKLTIAYAVAGKHESGYDLVQTLIDSKGVFSLPSMVILECLVFMAAKRKVYDDLYQYLIHSTTISNETWRLKRIIGLKNDLDVEVMLEGCKLAVLNQFTNHNKLLACQVMLTNNIEPWVSFAEEKLLEFIQGSEFDENTKADAADILRLHSTKEHVIEYARGILINLGRKQGLTIYDNSQNVHDNEIEASVIQCLSYLEKTKNSDDLIPLETVIKNILKIVSQEDLESIQLALDRIDIDQTIYFGKITLKSVLQDVYSRIIKHKYADDLQQRLIEELKETSGTCTTGYFSRLVNVFIGYDDNIKVTIGWQNQIMANLSARLNTKIQNSDNSDVLLTEMISTNIGKRGTFNRFFISVLPDIREEMYNEYKDYITDMQWEEYMKNAIIKYMIVM